MKQRTLTGLSGNTVTLLIPQTEADLEWLAEHEAEVDARLSFGDAAGASRKTFRKYSEDQPRDEAGRFGEGGGGAGGQSNTHLIPPFEHASYSGEGNKRGTLASESEHREAYDQAIGKVLAAPVPTAAEVVKARKDLAEAERAGGDSRGGSAEDRRKQRQNLFKQFGGEERGYVVCPWTGIKMHHSDDLSKNPNNYPVFERGKIFTKHQGGAYRLKNLIPESYKANRTRNDKPIRTENQD
jgi:hypothetical protein